MLAAQTIVQAIAAQIRTVPALATSTVTDRGWAFDAAELPACRVLADSENITQETMHGNPLQQHELSVQVVLCLQAADALDAAMHSLTESVLTAVGVQGFGGAGVGRTVIGLSRIERALQTADQASLGTVDITFSARFHTRANNPSQIL